MDRPCERCGNVSDISNYLMCQEIVMAHGVVAWICFDCRKEWHKVSKNQKLSVEYSEASLRFEYWKSKLVACGEGSFEDGLEAWRALDKLEIKLSSLASQWLITDTDDHDH